MYHLVMSLAQRDKVVFVVFMKVVNVTGIVSLLLLGDVVDIFYIFIAQGTFGQVELFVVLAAFTFVKFFDLAAVVAEELQTIEAVAASKL